MNPFIHTPTPRSLTDIQVDVKAFGAVGDGVTDDTAAINSADAALAALDGGVLYYPPGTYMVGYNELSGSQQACIVVSDGVFHVGSGRSATTIKQIDDENSHVFVFRGSTDCGISNITIDGNRSNQGTPASGNDPTGISAFDTITRVTLDSLHIKNTYDYGIGIEVGTAQYCSFSRLYIQNTGADGIDFKNISDNSKGNRLQDITVRDFGLLTSSEVFAGVDIRGQVQASQLRVTDFADDYVGIRLNPGEVADDNTGAHYSQVSDFYVAADSGNTGSGFHSRAYDVQVSNGFITGTQEGLVCTQREGAYSNIRIVDCTGIGLLLDDDDTNGGSGLLTDPDNCAFSNIVVRGCNVGLKVEGLNNSFCSCVFRSNTTNVNIDTGANNNTFVGGQISNPITTNLSDSGTGTILRGVIGESDS